MITFGIRIQRLRVAILLVKLLDWLTRRGVLERDEFLELAVAIFTIIPRAHIRGPLLRGWSRLPWLGRDEIEAMIHELSGFQRGRSA